MIQDQQNFYWLFSSSAQTISAFVAFLVTGFALVLNMMESLQQKDETLEDLHHKIKITYYNKLRILAIITGLSIIMSLWMVYLNGSTSNWKPYLFGFTALLNLAAMAFGIFFILAIINPNRYKKAAQEIIKEDNNDFDDTGKTADQTTFMLEFIKLETKIRNVLQMKSLYVPFGNTPKMAYSFRQMVQTLFQNELINRIQYDELMTINKYRNLVFHGHQTTVDEGMLQRLQTQLRHTDIILKNINY